MAYEITQSQEINVANGDVGVLINQLGDDGIEVRLWALEFVAWEFTDIQRLQKIHNVIGKALQEYKENWK